VDLIEERAAKRFLQKLKGRKSDLIVLAYLPN